MGSPAIFKGTKTQLLTTGGIKIVNGADLDLIPSTNDPAITAESADIGSIFINQTDGEHYRKLDSGSSTRWKKVDNPADSVSLVRADYFTTSEVTTGSDPIFDNGGSFNGTFTRSTTAADLISGSAVWKWVGNATAGNNDDDFIVHDAQDIPQGLRGRFLAFTGNFKWDGISGNIVVRVKDTTNNKILTTNSITLNAHDNADNTAAKFNAGFFCPPSCAQVEVGFQILTGEVSKTFIWDDLHISTDPFAIVDGSSPWTAYSPTLSAGFGTATSESFKFRQEGPDLLIDGTFVAGTVTGAVASFTIPSQFTIDYSSMLDSGRNILGVAHAIASARGLFDAGNTEDLFADGTDTSTIFFLQRGATTSSYLKEPVNGFIGSNIGISVRMRIPVTENLTSNIIGNSQSQNSEVTEHTSNLYGSTNTTIRRMTTTLVDTGNAITRADSAADGGSYTVNETGMYEVALTDGGSAAMQIGISVNSSELTTAIGSIAVADRVCMTDTAGADDMGSCSRKRIFNKDDVIRIHNDATGAAATPARVTFTISKIGTTQTTGVFLPLTAYIKDIKSNGTAGGGFTSGSFVTRDLNDLSGDTSFISLDGSNRFIIASGKYIIEVFAPAYRVLRHKALLRNITDSTNDIIGGNSVAGSSDDAMNLSVIIGEILITSSKEFEIQHRCDTTRATDGFGLAESYSTTYIINVYR